MVRFFLVHHFTWSINSLCHAVGDRPYRSNDSSTDLWLLAWPTLGESFHQTHHAFPWSALQGSARWNDWSYTIIRTLAFVGLAWNVRIPTAEQYAVKRVLVAVDAGAGAAEGNRFAASVAVPGEQDRLGEAGRAGRRRR